MASPPPRRRSDEMQSAVDILEEILAGEVGRPGFSAGDLERIERLRENQEKGAKILRAVRELLIEKGVLT